MNILKSLVLVVLLVVFCYQSVMTSQILIPVSVSSSKEDLRIEKCLNEVGVYKDINKLTNAIKIASKEHNLRPEFIISLTFTESTFNKHAKSSKNYQGYMQIPYSIYDATENILIGSRIMREKLGIVNGDTEKATCLYKGWGLNPSKEGIRQARQVIQIYNKLLKVRV